MTRYIVGVDFGGTKMRAGVVSFDEPDRVVWSGFAPTVREDPEQGVLALKRLVLEVLGKGGDGAVTADLLAAVGVGARGPFDDRKQEFVAFANLPAWTGFPLGARLSADLKVPVALGNDANVAALGEQRAGAGKGMRDVIFVTLGTGVGGAVIINGRLHAGATGKVGEFGHVQIDPQGHLCGCGKKGCVETFSSGPAIAREYGASTPEVFERAAAGETKAVEVLRRAGEALGIGLAAAVLAVDPEAIIAGGGLASGNPEAFRIYLKAAQTSLWERIKIPGYNPVPFIKGALGDDAGILGAAYLAREKALAVSPTRT